MSRIDSTDIKVGQVWERKTDGAQVHVERHAASHFQNPIVGIRGFRRSDIRADGLRSRYRLWRDVCEGCVHGPACVVLPCRDCGKSWHLLGQIANPFVCPRCEDAQEED